MRAPMCIGVVALAVTAATLTGCQRAGGDAANAAAPVTVTVTETPGTTPPLATDVPTANHEWTGGADGTAMFSVGTTVRDGMAAVIPPGRYDVKAASADADGTWMVCDAPTCGPAFQENATVIGHPVGPDSSIMYIGPGARTLWLHNVVLSAAND